MDLASRKSWFAAQPDAFRVLLLLRVMHELTIVLRVISSSGDDDLMRRSAWIISECNHRLVGYAFGVMTQRPRYPDDVIIGILFDYLEHATLEPYTRAVWDKAVEAATNFGANLLR
jgi:hypothetical protein